MRDALGAVQRVLVLGGTSEIGLAIVDELVSSARLVEVVLACRDPAAATPAIERLAAVGVSARSVAFDARAPETHAAVLDDAASAGDVDVVVVAVGVLGDQETLRRDPVATAALVNVNLAGCASAMVASAALFERQGHGRLVVLSSVAGLRVRPSNAVYGSTKAGLDGLALALADSLHGSGIGVVVVRPGFVHTRMTAGLDPAPLSTDPQTVARLTVEGMRAGRTVVWAPRSLRWMFLVLRALPAPLWRVVSARG